MSQRTTLEAELAALQRAKPTLRIFEQQRVERAREIVYLLERMPAGPPAPDAALEGMLERADAASPRNLRESRWR